MCRAVGGIVGKIDDYYRYLIRYLENSHLVLVCTSIHNALSTPGESSTRLGQLDVRQ